MSIFAKIKNLFSTRFSTCMYAIFGAVSLIVFSSLFIWAMQGVSATESSILSATVITDGSVRKEYLVGETFNADGLSLNIGTDEKPDIINVEDCTVSADFSGAGNKRVSVTYQVNANLSYVGYLDVKVYFVRGLKVVEQPTSITVNADGSFVADDGFEIHAELSGMPSDTVTFVPVTNELNFVKLTPNLYTTSTVASVNIDGYYMASIYCGNVSYGFNFYNVANKTFLVESEKNVVFFESSDQNSNSLLQLIVTKQSETYAHDSVGSTNGYYVYTDGIGESKVSDFKYTLTETNEQFNSTTGVNALSNESKDGSGNYKVTYNGENFTVASNLWQSAVVNGIIYKDGQFNLVIDSDARCLSLTNLTQGVTETLTLYVTNYSFDMSSGSGVSEGFYVFTDANGEKYKARFFMQTWSWDYVPLSSTKGDLYSNSIVGDWLGAKYQGPLYVDFSVYSRTNGWTKSSFTADMASLLKTAYAMK